MKTVTIYKVGAYFSAGIAAFFLPITWAFVVVSILVGVDTITGIMKAGKDSVSNIKSKKVFALIPKLTMYFLLVIVAHSCSYIDDQIPFVKLALGGICLIEIKSIDENFNELFGFSFLDKVFEMIRNLGKYKRS